MISELVSELVLELVSELVSELIPKLIGDPDGCPLTITTGIDKITSIYAPPLSPSPLAPNRSSWGLHIWAHFSNNNKEQLREPL